jgi:hypothetical protein
MVSSSLRAAVAAVAAAVALFSDPGVVSAQQTAPAPAAAPAPPKPAPAEPPGEQAAKNQPPPATPPATIPADEKRKLPDYDQRGKEPTTAGDVLIWVPRVALSPLYLISEFVIRRPLGWLVTTAEHEKIPTLLIDFFTFGEDRQAGIIPTALIDFGFQPSVGLYFFWNEFLARNNKLRARAAYGGEDWLMLNLADRVEIFRGHEIGVRGEYLSRPDRLFFGFGPQSPAPEGLGGGPRFRLRGIEGGAFYDAELWRSSGFHSYVAVRSVDMDANSGCCSDPTVAEVIAAGRYPEPPFLDDGYTVLRQGIEAALDTRWPRDQTPHFETDGSEPPGTGIRMLGRVEYSTGLHKNRPFSFSPEKENYAWIRYGGAIGGFVDVTGYQRLLGLSVLAEFADPTIEDGEIPFTEQITLGGNRPMRAFLSGRLVDRSAAVAQLSYEWPVWVFLDGGLHYAVGNVFGEHLDGFEPGLLRQSFTLGLRSNTSRDHPFEILLGFGTKTFDEGSELDSLRIQFGATSGF